MSGYRSSVAALTGFDVQPDLIAVQCSEMPKLARRDFIRCAGIAAVLMSCGLVPRASLAQGFQLAAEARSFDAALERLGGMPAATGQIAMTLPAYVEDGGVVPVTIRSGLDQTSAIYVLSDINPVPLAVGFTIPDETMPEVSIRIKLAQSGGVYAVVRSGGELFWTSSQVKVTVGGCSS